MLICYAHEAFSWFHGIDICPIGVQTSAATRLCVRWLLIYECDEHLKQLKYSNFLAPIPVHHNKI